jgi:biotin carboxylase
MNLLVTNTRNAQAYAIIRALRPYANKIVATMEGDNRIAARLSHAANSRFLDKRCYAPSRATDWRAGRIQKENTEGEEAYVRAVMRICEEEKIDTIFPSFDPHIYVFSKNKARFERIGVLIPVPDYETVITPLDKYRTIQAAQEVGFPCPRTYLPDGEEDLKEIAEELDFPLVIKPRFTAGGRGTVAVKDFAELIEAMKVVENDRMHMIQEYIPGRRQQHFNLVLDKNGVLKSALSREIHRFFLPKIIQNAPTASESIDSSDCSLHAGRLAQILGWWGGITVQTKVDHRDGVPKLMEINPRLGFTLWNRTEVGINEPLLCLKMARGENVEAIGHYPSGTIFISPLEDAQALMFKLLDLFASKCRVRIQSRAEVIPDARPVSVTELVRSYRSTYFNRKTKVFSPYFRYWLEDPLVCFLWWCQGCLLMLRATKQLGR